jgi:hypothetical protein
MTLWTWGWAGQLSMLQMASVWLWCPTPPARSQSPCTTLLMAWIMSWHEPRGVAWGINDKAAALCEAYASMPRITRACAPRNEQMAMGGMRVGRVATPDNFGRYSGDHGGSSACKHPVPFGQWWLCNARERHARSCQCILQFHVCISEPRLAQRYGAQIWLISKCVQLVCTHLHWNHLKHWPTRQASRPVACTANPSTVHLPQCQATPSCSLWHTLAAVMPPSAAVSCHRPRG